VTGFGAGVGGELATVRFRSAAADVRSWAESLFARHRQRPEAVRGRLWEEAADGHQYALTLETLGAAAGDEAAEELRSDDELAALAEAAAVVDRYRLAIDLMAGDLPVDTSKGAR
jgi:hypothetical protein